MIIHVLNKHNEPLMPCSVKTTKMLLKQDKAKVIKRTPFTIKLLFGSSGYKQNLVLGIDTGSSVIGSAVINTKNEVIYLSEIQIRNDISDKMKRRSEYRRNRRNRKTRYRKARFLNRKNSIRKYRFSPTMTSKIQSHIKEIKFVKSILPITKLIIESSTFDAHALKNPEVLKNKSLYQKGINYGLANTKAYVLNRDNYTCQYCKSCKNKSKNSFKNNTLHVHHIIFRSHNGSDEADNLITLCEICHIKLHKNEIKLKTNGKKKTRLKHATQMNCIRSELFKYFHEAIETFGFITKEHRQLLNLNKSHCIDAAVIASEDATIKHITNCILYKKCVPDGDYKLRKGSRSEQIMPVRKIQGFRKFDKVLYKNKEYFIKGRMSSGYCTLMNIKGEQIKVKPMAKFSTITRIQAIKSWIMQLVFTLT